MIGLYYYSGTSENTKRFVDKLGIDYAKRISINPEDSPLFADREYVLICPSYGGGSKEKSVPRSVINFLNVEQNRKLLRGVISPGNMNFREYYGVSGRIIAEKCNVPSLYQFELFGLSEDVDYVRKGLEIW